MAAMTIKEARGIAARFYRNTNPSEEDIFLYTEAMDFLVHKEHRPEDMMELGGWYYGERRFDLALKYYEMASAFDIDPADEGLGYIWYYGRTGQVDYEKAYRHYAKSMARGNLVSTYKVADMYKNGYFVGKDDAKYKKIIEQLYPKVSHARFLNEPLPEVFTRLARIRKEEGNMEAAADLYLKAKDFLAQRIRYNPFFGNLSIMKWLIDDLYEIISFDPDDMDFYDLFYVLNRPARVSFIYQGQEQALESLTEDGTLVVRFNDKWFRTRDDFFLKAVIDERKLTDMYDDLYGFKVVMDHGDH